MNISSPLVLMALIALGGAASKPSFANASHVPDRSSTIQRLWSECLSRGANEGDWTIIKCNRVARNEYDKLMNLQLDALGIVLPLHDKHMLLLSQKKWAEKSATVCDNDPEYLRNKDAGWQGTMNLVAHGYCELEAVRDRIDWLNVRLRQTSHRQ